MQSTFIVILNFLLLLVNAAEIVKDHCASSDTCQDCIRKPTCLWNTDEDLKGNEKRCLSSSTLTELKSHFYNPNSSLHLIENNPTDEKILVSPQKVQLNLRIGSPVEFQIAVDSSNGFAPPHFDNIIVQFVRKDAKQISTRIEALSCPNEISRYHQNLELNSFEPNQKIILDVNLQCACNFNAQ